MACTSGLFYALFGQPPPALLGVQHPQPKVPQDLPFEGLWNLHCVGMIQALTMDDQLSFQFLFPPEVVGRPESPVLLTEVLSVPGKHLPSQGH